MPREQNHLPTIGELVAEWDIETEEMARNLVNDPNWGRVYQVPLFEKPLTVVEPPKPESKLTDADVNIILDQDEATLAIWRDVVYNNGWPIELGEPGDTEHKAAVKDYIKSLTGPQPTETQ